VAYPAFNPLIKLASHSLCQSFGAKGVVILTFQPAIGTPPLGAAGLASLRRIFGLHHGPGADRSWPSGGDRLLSVTVGFHVTTPAKCFARIALATRSAEFLDFEFIAAR
jgi:hypothetical protein